MTDTQPSLFDLPPVTLEARWEDLLGKSCRSTEEGERRRRWAIWLRLARRRDADLARAWTDVEACDDCRHCRGSWCTQMGLPVTVNPVLTMRHGMIGMACMGAGHEPRDGVAKEPGDPSIPF